MVEQGIVREEDMLGNHESDFAANEGAKAVGSAQLSASYYYQRRQKKYIELGRKVVDIILATVTHYGKFLEEQAKNTKHQSETQKRQKLMILTKMMHIVTHHGPNFVI